MANLLVIDDDVDVAGTIQRSLRRRGHQVSVAHSGPAGIATLHTSSIDLILLDIRMDRMDGIAVCQIIRSDPRLRHLPIIFLSALADIETKVLGLRSGGDDYITKPFAPEELVVRVKAVLERSQEKQREADEVSIAGGQLTLDPRTWKITMEGQTVRLSRTEFKVLQYLALFAGHFCTTDELLQHIWGFEPGTGDPALVRAQIKNIRRKLDAIADAARFLETQPGEGYQVLP